MSWATEASLQVDKAATGIFGLDEILQGGLPRGRATLVCGGPGCGKTLVALEFILRGARDLGEPGVFIAFEETADELAANVASLGFDVADLCASGKLVVDHVAVNADEIQETGEYDLEALLLRVEHAIDTVGAVRVAIDSLEALFAALGNDSILRAELHRLLRRLKQRGQTVLVTGEAGTDALTRHGIEEYVSDCVLALDNRVENQISRRRLRVLKYRGSGHGANEYPYLIDAAGITIVPITSVGLDAPASLEQVSSGVAELDQMLSGGYYRGSTVLVSGPPGAGKTSLAAHFARAVCERGEQCIYLLLEESPKQLLRNMRSIGIDLQPWIDKGLLQLVASRPTAFGLEAQLANLQRLIESSRPSAVVIDPASNLGAIAGDREIADHHLRQFDLLKSYGVTTFATALTGRDDTGSSVSSLMDTWIALRTLELDGETNRTLHVVKARGVGHSNQVRECVLGGDGVHLLDVSLGEDGVLTGSARLKQEQREKALALARADEIRSRHNVVEQHRLRAEAEITRIREELAREAAELERVEANYERDLATGRADLATLSSARHGDTQTDRS